MTISTASAARPSPRRRRASRWWRSDAPLAAAARGRPCRRLADDLCRHDHAAAVLLRDLPRRRHRAEAPAAGAAMGGSARAGAAARRATDRDIDAAPALAQAAEPVHPTPVAALEP